MPIRSELAILGGSPKLAMDEFPRDRVAISEAGIKAVSDTLLTGQWSMFSSTEVSKFEVEFSDLVGAHHTVFVNSCTNAILSSLRALRLSSGSMVGVPAFTYVGTCMPLVEIGASPVWIDVSCSSQNMDPSALRSVLSCTKLDAVVFPLLFGDESNAFHCAAICSEKGIPIIFDCAQYLGNYKVTSELCEIGLCCFSFGESKVLRLGEGGAVTTNSQSLYEAALKYRHEGESWLGKDGSRVSLTDLSPNDVLKALASSYHGLNLRPLATHAALGRVKISELPEALDATSRNARALIELLEDEENVALPLDREVWWTFPLTIANERLSRNVLLAALLAEGVPAGVHFPRLLPDQPIFAGSCSAESSYPNAARFSSNHVVLPIYPSLDESHMRKIAEVVTYVLADRNLYEPSAQTVARRFLANAKLSELSSGLYMFLEPFEEKTYV